MTDTLASAMKLGMRRLTSGVSIVTSLGVDEQKYAMTASSVTSLTDAPASLLVCIHQQARIHSVLTPGQTFAINVLARHHESLASLCASHDQGAKRFEIGDWCFEPKTPPYLKDAEAVFMCELDTILPFGTHSIAVGLIKKVTVTSSLPNPLLYLNGAYHSISGHS